MREMLSPLFKASSDAPDWRSVTLPKAIVVAKNDYSHGKK